MDILLLFPPLWNHEHPHLGLPTLKSYLAVNGYPSCQVKDYNVVIMDRIIREHICCNNEIVKNYGQNILHNYIQAKKIMKGNSMSDKLKSGWAMALITRYMMAAGIYIYKNISFDPVSFCAVEQKFEETDLNSEDNLVFKYIRDEVIPDIIGYQPLMIGFSIVFPSQLLYTFVICKQIKKMMPNLKIVFGGPQVSLFWRAFMNSNVFCPYFDGIVREQGETALLALADCWVRNKKSPADVPNLVYRDNHGTVRVNPVADTVNMNDIPAPDFRDLPMDLYCYPKLPYQMTRGCYWGKCAFCGYRGCSSGYMMSWKEKVIDDLKTLKERHGVHIFHFVDDVILPEYMIDIARLIINNRLDIIFAAYLRSEKEFTENNCRILYDAGLRSVLFGFESANTRILKLMEKGMSLKGMVSVLRNFKKAGIENHLSCIIGFPTEHRHEACETIDFLANNRNIYHKAYLNPFRLFSNMVDRADKYFIENINLYNPKRHDLTGYLSFEYSYNVRKGMSIDESIEVLNEGRARIGSVIPGPIYFNIYD